MMNDQAAELRRLARQSARAAAPAGQTPRFVSLVGGKGGVGTTTLGVNVAVAMAAQGQRVILVDANLYRADVANMCRLNPPGSVADVLAARRDVHEIFAAGPGGIQVAAGLWTPGVVANYTEQSQERLLRQLKSLGRHADVILLDVGCGASDVVGRFWKASDHVVLVTTPDSVAIMDSYATIKTLDDAGGNTQLGVIVNHAETGDEALAVHQRLNQSCERFLGKSIHLLGILETDERLPGALRSGKPVVLSAPTSAIAVTFDQIAGQLIEHPRKRATA